MKLTGKCTTCGHSLEVTIPDDAPAAVEDVKCEGCGSNALFVYDPNRPPQESGQGPQLATFSEAATKLLKENWGKRQHA